VSLKIDEILRFAAEHDASDIHIVAWHPPVMRVHTEMTPMDFPAVAPDTVQAIMEEISPAPAKELFARQQDADFSYESPGLGRYRVNAHLQRGALGIAMRAIKSDAPDLGKLNLPDVIERLTYLPRGLVLVTGDTGSGKTTTLAAMIQAINERYRKHIITLEDPIEYALESHQCLVEQRELGQDMPSFASALKHALRQDPDIILVGEMRDLDTTALAMTAAETGHLVLSTLHTVNASQTVERIIDMYPAGQQNQIRAMLADTLQAVISQTLFKRSDTRGMVPAAEILLCTPAVRNIIREGRTFEIPNVIETNRAMGMIGLDSAIASLFFNGMISKEDALAQSVYPEKLEQQLAA
jgi:twitching motility protein PilT